MLHWLGAYLHQLRRILFSTPTLAIFPQVIADDKTRTGAGTADRDLIGLRAVCKTLETTAYIRAVHHLPLCVYLMPD